MLQHQEGTSDRNTLSILENTSKTRTICGYFRLKKKISGSSNGVPT